MDVKTAVLIAFGLAVGLPYLTVVLMQGGQLGFILVGLIFIAGFLIIIVSEYRGRQRMEAEADGQPVESGNSE